MIFTGHNTDSWDSDGVGEDNVRSSLIFRTGVEYNLCKEYLDGMCRIEIKES
jgi:hypothetical protein